MKRVAILGASGYTGAEVRRLLRSHPEIQVDLAMTARANHEPAAPPLPYDHAVQPLDLDKLKYVDGVFVCAPHGASATLAAAALERDSVVVDLSADFRLRDPDVYAAAYGVEHPVPGLLADATYGLTEHARAQVAASRLVANPGCYPTSILLPLLPLLHADLLDLSIPIVADATSGISGAGKTPNDKTLFGNRHDNTAAYGIGTHRHIPEIHQEAGTDRIVFVPHLLPLFRGMLTTIYVTPKSGVGAPDILARLDDAYAVEPFLRVYPHGLPEVNRVQHTNFCDIGVASAGPCVVLVSAIDNLVKGAAGQAIQNMNLMLGLDEEAGLP